MEEGGKIDEPHSPARRRTPLRWHPGRDFLDRVAEPRAQPELDLVRVARRVDPGHPAAQARPVRGLEDGRDLLRAGELAPQRLVGALAVARLHASLDVFHRRGSAASLARQLLDDRGDGGVEPRGERRAVGCVGAERRLGGTDPVEPRLRGCGVSAPQPLDARLGALGDPTRPRPRVDDDLRGLALAPRDGGARFRLGRSTRPMASSTAASGVVVARGLAILFPRTGCRRTLAYWAGFRCRPA